MRELVLILVCIASISCSKTIRHEDNESPHAAIDRYLEQRFDSEIQYSTVSISNTELLVILQSVPVIMYFRKSGTKLKKEYEIRESAHFFLAESAVVKGDVLYIQPWLGSGSGVLRHHLYMYRLPHLEKQFKYQIRYEDNRFLIDNEPGIIKINATNIVYDTNTFRLDFFLRINAMTNASSFQFRYYPSAEQWGTDLYFPESNEIVNRHRFQAGKPYAVIPVIEINKTVDGFKTNFFVQHGESLVATELLIE